MPEGRHAGDPHELLLSVGVGGRSAHFADAHVDLWHQCISRGAGLSDLPWFRAIQDRFRSDVLALARHHLAQNERLVRAELAALGPDEAAPGPAAASRVPRPCRPPPRR